MRLNLAPILHAILEEYALPRGGPHGIAHWARVLENGIRLAAETGASVRVVQLFAILHDSRRLNEGWDPDHGPRAAAYAEDLRGCSSTSPTRSSASCIERVPGILASVIIPTSPSGRVGTPTASILAGSASRRIRASFAPMRRSPGDPQVGRRPGEHGRGPGACQDGMGDPVGA